MYPHVINIQPLMAVVRESVINIQPLMAVVRESESYWHRNLQYSFR